MRKIVCVVVAICFFCLQSNAQKLMLYGGANGKEYMGCINASSFDSESIWNQFGDYGSKFSTKSIWNQFGDYGSKFSSYSPWNESTTTPPKIYDQNGKFLGYFTRNKAISNRYISDATTMIYMFYDFIPDDVSKWYDKLFNDLKLKFTKKVE